MLVGCAAQPHAPPVLLHSTGGVASPSLAGGAPNAPTSPPVAVDIPPDLQAILDDELVAARAHEVVRALVDEVGPRLAGSPADAAATDWAVKTMGAMGYANVHKEPVKVARWERGSVEEVSVIAPAHALTATALGGSVGTPAAGVEGEVLRVEDLDALDGLATADVAGKIVFFSGRMEHSSDFSEYGRAVGPRVKGAIAASKKGAVAVLVRSIGTDDNRLPHTGFVKMPEPSDGTKAIPAAALAAPDADMLERLLEATRTAVRVRVRLSCRRLPDAPSANVVGEITGREKPDQLVLVGAHLDSWDLGHGALDDGAGVAIALSAVKLAAARRPPRRTMRVVLFAGEELSGAGAKQYAADHAKELDKHVVAFEADAGDGAVQTFRWLGSLEGKGLAEHVGARLSQALGIDALTESAEGGSDVGALRAQGVPVIDLGQDMNRYFDYHHTANDTFDKIDADALTSATRAYAAAAWSFAEAGDDLGRVPQSQRVRAWK